MIGVQKGEDAPVEGKDVRHPRQGDGVDRVILPAQIAGRPGLAAVGEVEAVVIVGSQAHHQRGAAGIGVGILLGIEDLRHRNLGPFHRQEGVCAQARVDQHLAVGRGAQGLGLAGKGPDFWLEAAGEEGVEAGILVRGQLDLG